MRLIGFAIALFLIAASAEAQRPVASSTARVIVERSDDRGVIVRVSGLRADARLERGSIRIVHNAPRYRHASDSTMLPSLRFTVAVPFGAPGFSAAASGIRSIVSPLDARARNIGAGPADVRVGSVVLMRNLSTVTVAYAPVRASAGMLTTDTSFTITLRWSQSPTTSIAKEVTAEIPGIEDAMRGAIVNYAQARSWRRWSSPSMRLQSIDAGWGIGEAIVLATARDGIYGITADELFATGASSLRGAATERLALQNRREPQALYVADVNANGVFDGGDYLEFVGRRNRGVEGHYFDAVTDTNAYILSWDARASSPRTFGAAHPVGSPELVSYDSTLHFEQENEQNYGFTYPDNERDGGDVKSLHVPERVAAERLYWADIRGVRLVGVSLPFSCAPVLDAGATYTLRVRLANIYQDVATVRLALNEYAQVGTYQIHARSDTTIIAVVPASYLVNGANALGIAVSGIDDTTSFRVYVDYIQLTGRWRPSADAVNPVVRIPSQTEPGAPLRVRINGLRAPASVATSRSTRVGVDSSDERGVHFRLTSRIYLQGVHRENRGFVAQFGDTSVRSGQWALGLMFAEVDAAGRLVRSAFFTTHASASELDRAAGFINSAAQGNYLVLGSAHGFGPNPLPQSLRDALTAVGSRSASLSGYENAAWAFVARKGNPASAREAFAPLTGPESNGVTLDEFFASEQGNRYRAVFTIAGMPGEEFVVASPETPGVRYHERDVLVSSENQADLIIITHPRFREASERLAAHRRKHGPSRDAEFSVKVVDVMTVYDEFGAGIKNQLPIRSFLQYADTFWVAPKPGYVLLVGDASFDPQKRLEKSTMTDFVPTFGEPASDYWYTMPFGGRSDDALDLWPFDTAVSYRQFIGRLPAMTTRDADVMVDKIIEYDTMAPAAWNKRFIFVAGGSSFSEVDGNLYLAETVSRDYITSATFAGDTTVVYRRVIEPFPSKPPHPDSRWAQEAMSEGGIWANSAGHGSRTVLDLDFGMPSEIDNQNRYFVLGTFSCQTGAFSDIESSLRNEDFLKAEGRGSIASYGATNWSFQQINNETELLIFAKMTTPPFINNLGAITTQAKWETFLGNEVVWMHSTEGFRRRNHLLTYTLLGDPSMDLKISRQRELAFEDARFTNGVSGDIAVDDTAAILTAELFNYGRTILPTDDDVDSLITVVGTIIGPDASERRDTFTVRYLKRSQSVRLVLPLDGKPGEYTVRLEVDPEGQVSEGYRADNIIVLQLRVRGNQVLPLEPIPNGRVGSYDEVVIRLLNPPSGPGAEIVVDTVPTFDSPAAFTSASTGSIASDDLTTTWTFSMPAAMRSAKRFWWKAIALSGDQEVARLFPVIETFTVEEDAGAEFLMSGRLQMARSNIVGVDNSDEGVAARARRMRISVEAIGQGRYPNGEEITLPKISFAVHPSDGRTLQYADNNQFGLHIRVLDPETLEAIPGMYSVFYLFENEQNIDSLVRFVASIPSGHPVLVGTMGLSLSGLRESAAFQGALASLGAAITPDSVSEIDSYALIGGKGLPAVQHWIFGEELRRRRADSGYARVVAVTHLMAQPSAGQLTTPTIGPATAWRSARMITGSNGPRPNVTVIGVRRDGLRDSLAYWASASSIDLSSIDVARYPRLELRAHFPLDSTVRLLAIEADFDPSPELAIVPRSIGVDRDSVLQGDDAALELTVVNLSRRYSADSVEVRLSHRSLGESRPMASQRVTLAPLERREITFDLVTDRFGASNIFFVQLNPDDVPSEPYRQNNADTARMRAGVDTARPTLAVYADGVRIMEGDYVNPTARFEVRLYDNSRLRINDSTSITVLLDLNQITLDSGAVFTQQTSGDAAATFVYSVAAPGLADGEHDITYWGRDASGNQTEAEFIRFFVERGLKIVRTVNYPNPFRDRTEFTFSITGSTPPTSGEIAIYTISGRKIKTIRLGPAELHLGFNHIEWDGRDEDRDRIANGVYLYRVMIENADGRVEVLEKLVVMQ